MPFQRPPLSQLRRDAAADVASNIQGGDGLLRFSNLLVTSTILSGMANLHYGYLDWIAKQSVPFTASDEYLAGWAALKNVTQIDAQAATGTATFTGTNGVLLPAGTLLVRADQRTFITAADQTVAGSTVTVTAIDQTPGAAGNMAPGVVLTINPPINGIISQGASATNFTDGADLEQTEPFRDRMLEAYQNPPQGGALQDYVTWALAVPGVTRVWPIANGMGLGTVTVYFMMDVTEAAFGGFPQGTNGVATLETRDIAATGDQLAVANYIYPLRPATALVYSVAPAAAPQNFTISNLIPNTTAIKASISAAISDTFARLGVANGGTIYLADIEASINAISGIQDFIIVGGADVVTTVGNLPTLGTITYS